MTPNDTQKLYGSIIKILMDRGIKATTMDEVASALGMSKRTLYEIFSSKMEMVERVMLYYRELDIKRHKEITENSHNMMEALIRILKDHINIIDQVSIDFLRDVEEYMPSLRSMVRNEYREKTNVVMQVFEKGIAEGVFRANVDYHLFMLCVHVQMESVKRAGSNLPAGVTMPLMYKFMSFNFLRSIATVKGLEVIEQFETEQPL